MQNDEHNPRTFEGQNAVRKAIEKYLKSRGMTSLRKIAAFVEKETGISTTPSTVRRIVNKFGYVRQVVEWEKIEETTEWVKKE